MCLSSPVTAAWIVSGSNRVSYHYQMFFGVCQYKRLVIQGDGLALFSKRNSTLALKSLVTMQETCAEGAACVDFSVTLRVVF